MAGKKAATKKAPAKKASAKREREVVNPDSDEEGPQAKKPKKAGGVTRKIDGLEELFSRYVEETKKAMMDSDDAGAAEIDCIGPGGIQKMCEDIGVEIDDICLLIMAWHLGATRVGFFSKEAWMKLSNFGISNLETLRAKVPQFRKDIQNIDNAKRLFLFTFNYVRESPETKVIPVEIAEGYIRLILPDSVHTEPFCDFLLKQKEEPKGYRAINLDQWKMWFEFTHTVPGDLSTYDEEAAWPLIIDNYVIQRRAFLSSNGMQTSSS